MLWCCITAGICSLATLPSKQGLKQKTIATFVAHHSHSRYTSIKTRIETPLSNVRTKASRLSLHFHQNKDWNWCGGTPTPYATTTSRYTSIKTRIETCHTSSEASADSLSLHFHQNKDWNLGLTFQCINSQSASRYTSIKTRIETRLQHNRSCCGSSLATLPSKQGLKPDETAGAVPVPLLSLHFHQNKDWNSWLPTAPIAQCPTLATLPSKQGLKLKVNSAQGVRAVVLSLHFHQNKDWNPMIPADVRPALSSRYTSIKTRIETCSKWAYCI